LLYDEKKGVVEVTAAIKEVAVTRLFIHTR